MSNLNPLKSRRKSREVLIGKIGIGGHNPIRVQTMTNTDTLNVEATYKQIAECAKLGAELVRITTPSLKHVKALGEIREILKSKHGVEIPLIADVHFSMPVAMLALEYADKVRVNPGNLLDKKTIDGALDSPLPYEGVASQSDDGVVLSSLKKHPTSTAGTPLQEGNLEPKETQNKPQNDTLYTKELDRIEEGLLPFIQKAKELKKPVRIGANHGSLSNRILAKYGDTPKGMVESAMEFLRIFKKHDYNDVIVAMKASNPLVMIEANRLLVEALNKENMDYPIHLGVTESGSGFDGRAKSTLGIGTLLLDGIGDTIRVSLTEDPQEEIPVCYSILQAARRRITKTEFISCPSCGRTLFNLQEVTERIKARTGHLKGVTIAIMGCIVNGLGEMADADFGYVGGRPGKINLYYKSELIKANVPEDEALDELVELIKSKGLWAEF